MLFILLFYSYYIVISQDYYCDLSPLQERLYEDFAKSRAGQELGGATIKEEGAGAAKPKDHVFQVSNEFCLVVVVFWELYLLFIFQFLRSTCIYFNFPPNKFSIWAKTYFCYLSTYLSSLLKLTRSLNWNIDFANYPYLLLQFQARGISAIFFLFSFTLSSSVFQTFLQIWCIVLVISTNYPFAFSSQFQTSNSFYFKQYPLLSRFQMFYLRNFFSFLSSHHFAFCLYPFS